MRNRLVQTSALAILAFALLLTPACQSTGKIIVSTVQVGMAAMEGWWTYAAANPVTPAQDLAVRNAYQQFQLAADVADKAYAASNGDKTVLKATKDALIASQTSLLQLINTFSYGKAKPVTKGTP
jgi:hypothetical protein